MRDLLFDAPPPRGRESRARRPISIAAADDATLLRELELARRGIASDRLHALRTEVARRVDARPGAAHFFGGVL